MARATGFIEYAREEPGHRPVAERVGDFLEIELPLPEPALLRQALRCMDCGIPYCHAVGCPVRNRIPEFNTLVAGDRWREAAENLHSTNNFPEITGRVCPAPCEPACTLELERVPVLIKHLELRIAERAFAEGWVKPLRPARRTGRRVAVVGSGPAGLAAAQQLARLGHEVTVFERSDRVGGLLRYGIPDFKLDKRVLDRRLGQLAAEGVEFQTGVVVGQDLSARYLRQRFDAVLLAIGAGAARDLEVQGRRAENVVLALDFLTRQNRVVAGDRVELHEAATAQGKVVAVLGGGDTGSDCVGTARRQGARAVHQLELLPRPAEARPPHTPWPLWPQVLRTTTSHEEGCERRWSVLTTRLSGENGRVTRLHGVEVEWSRCGVGLEMREVPGTEFELGVDLVILAMGFTHVEHQGLVEPLGLALDGRGNVAAPGAATSLEGVFAAGDAVAGASLVVTAIFQGREAAASIHGWLAGR